MEKLLLMSISLLLVVDSGIPDQVLSRLGLPALFWHACFEYHARVQLRFKLAVALVCLGPQMEDSSEIHVEYDVYCCSQPSLASVFGG